jgi:hypothetical protein
MTLPLTRTPQRSSSQNRPPGWRGWLARRVAALGRQRAAALCAALERDWMAVLLAGCAVFACVVAAVSANPPQRMWGAVAAGGYGLAALVALAGRGRAMQLAAVISMGGALIAPLAWMASTGTGQPEVGVVIRSAVLFLHHGTPYQSAAAIAAAQGNPSVYDPYLPALAVFGIPHALFGGGLLTDPRVWFGVVFVAGFGLALSVSGVVRPWAAAVLVTASPVVAYPLATGGDDLPVLALICLGLAMLRPAWAAPARSAAAPALRSSPPPAAHATVQVVAAGVALGLAASMKATAWPALAVALALVAARSGKRAATWLTLITLSVPLIVDGPVLLTEPGSVVSNTILFPLGLTKIKSPAASMLPGHLISAAWSWGHWVAISLVVLAGLAVAVWLITRPPRDAQAAAWRLVIGLTLMFALAPASRFGYVVYPLGLACWLLLARLTTRPRQLVTSMLPPRTEVR